MGPKARVAVIELPGSNCEAETRLALLAAGVDSDIVRWNADPARLESYTGYVLPGGFSYQDRVRAGALAAKETVMEVVARGVELGKTVLGICNGCQILVEAGLVPGISPGEVEMAVAPNRRPGGRGYYCRWVYVRLAARPGRCLLTRPLESGVVLPLPIAHAEGRFTTMSPSLLETLRENDQIVFQYSDARGRVIEDSRVNPNGSIANVAGICNVEGNVLALMPHPERAAWLRQVPEGMESAWADLRGFASGDWKAMGKEGPGRALFAAFQENER